jgi:biofilm PGA synthesis N-glycosyltransferase PgaC
MPSYATITPARDEAENLARLAECVVSQTRKPSVWVIVDSGSVDATLSVARELAAEHAWIRVRSLPGEAVPRRGGPVVRALMAGIAKLGDAPDIVVKLDADTSMAPDYFERLMAEFAADPRLGIASGGRLEMDGGCWRRRNLTGTSVEGMCRAYRWACFLDVSPLEERMGWDGLDEMKANGLGWTTRTFRDLPFLHHRTIAARDTSQIGAWVSQGRANHYMGYRPTYMLLRTALHVRRDIGAAALMWGYVGAALRGTRRCPDAGVRDHVRRQQSFRSLPARAREAVARG